MLYEFLAWLQEQEHLWKAKDIPEEECPPEMPHEYCLADESETWMASDAARHEHDQVALRLCC